MLGDLGLRVGPRPEPGEGIVRFRSEHLARKGELGVDNPDLACVQIQFADMVACNHA